MTTAMAQQHHRLPEEAKELAAEALMLAQEAKDIAQRLARIKSKLTSMTVKLDTPPPAAPAVAAAKALSMVPEETTVVETTAESDPVSTDTIMTEKENDDAIDAVAQDPDAMATEEEENNDEGENEQAMKTDSPSPRNHDDGISALTTNSSYELDAAESLVSPIKESKIPETEEGEKEAENNYIDVDIAAEKEEEVEDAVPVPTSTDTALEEKHEGPTAEEAIAAAIAVVKQIDDEKQKDQQEQDAVEKIDQAADLVVDPSPPVEEQNADLAEEKTVESNEIGEDMQSEKEPEAPVQEDSPINEEMACPNDPTLEEVANSQVESEGEQKPDDVEPSTNNATIHGEGTGAEQVAPRAYAMPSPPKEDPSMEEQLRTVARQIDVALLRSRIQKGTFESILDGIGVDRMCGIDNVALGLSTSESSAAEEDHNASNPTFVNPTKLSLSSEKDMMMDPFGADHDALVMCGKIADVCDVELDQTLSNVGVDAVQQALSGEDTSVVKAVNKHIFGLMG